ncbi:hypothetical protein BT69DRAFT_1293422 [Atractiella rhizophila]|nr:hypothetical protein BT69DRAFT_1293422 [Atractiella rhizophila]
MDIMDFSILSPSSTTTPQYATPHLSTSIPVQTIAGLSHEQLVFNSLYVQYWKDSINSQVVMSANQSVIELLNDKIKTLEEKVKTMQFPANISNPIAHPHSLATATPLAAANPPPAYQRANYPNIRYWTKGEIDTAIQGKTSIRKQLQLGNGEFIHQLPIMKIVKNLVDETILEMKKTVNGQTVRWTKFSQEIREWGVRNLMAGHEVFRLCDGDEKARRYLIAVLEHAAGNNTDAKVAAREQKRREKYTTMDDDEDKAEDVVTSTVPQTIKITVPQNHRRPPSEPSRLPLEVAVRDGNDVIAAEGQNTPAGGQSEPTRESQPSTRTMQALVAAMIGSGIDETTTTSASSNNTASAIASANEDNLATNSNTDDGTMVSYAATSHLTGTRVDNTTSSTIKVGETGVASRTRKRKGREQEGDIEEGVNNKKKKKGAKKSKA